MSALAATRRFRPVDAWRNASAKTREQWLLAAVLVTPALVLMGVIVFFPALQTIGLSFYKWDGISPDMGDIRRFQDLRRGRPNNYPFSQAIRNSLLWGVVGLVCTNSNRTGCRGPG